jgi:hypothetical protein
MMSAASTAPAAIRLATFCSPSTNTLWLVIRMPTSSCAVGDAVQHAVEPARQPLGELVHLQQAGEHGRRRGALPQPLLHQVGGVAADRGVGLEARVQRAADLVEVHQRLAERGQLRREEQPALPGAARDLDHQPADLQLLGRGVVVAHHQVGDPLLEGALVEHRPARADVDEQVGGLPGAAVAHGQQHAEQLVLQVAGDPAHHPDVDQREPVVVGEEDVPRVRVGVEEAVDQDLLKVGLEEVVRERPRRPSPSGPWGRWR